MSVAVVLVVDDDFGTREAVHDILLEEGYGVMLAENGRDAVEQVSRHQPDIVLTDLEMPEVDGERLIAELRAAGYVMPILVITSRLVVDAERAAKRLGSDGYLNKPIQIDRLVDEVRRALRRG